MGQGDWVVPGIAHFKVWSQSSLFLLSRLSKLCFPDLCNLKLRKKERLEVRSCDVRFSDKISSFCSTNVGMLGAYCVNLNPAFPTLTEAHHFII